MLYKDVLSKSEKELLKCCLKNLKGIHLINTDEIKKHLTDWDADTIYSVAKSLQDKNLIYELDHNVTMYAWFLLTENGKNYLELRRKVFFTTLQKSILVPILVSLATTGLALLLFK